MRMRWVTSFLTLIVDILLPQDEDDTLKSSNSVPDVPGPVRKDSAWRRKFDEAATDTLLT